MAIFNIIPTKKQIFKVIFFLKGWPINSEKRRSVNRLLLDTLHPGIGLGLRNARFCTLNLKIARNFNRECAIFTSFINFLIKAHIPLKNEFALGAQPK